MTTETHEALTDVERAIETISVPTPELAFDATVGVHATPSAVVATHTQVSKQVESPRFDVDRRDEVPAFSSLIPCQDDFELVHLLGEGGMGQVHLARQRSLQREVAVKTVHPGASSEAADLLVHEARTFGALEHPGIVPLHALGRDAAGRPLLVMKRVDGVVWRDLVRQLGDRAWSRFPDAAGDRLGWHLGILMNVCNSTHFAHSRGIVHRDIKPENVMIGDFGEVYLMDWGTAVHFDSFESRDIGRFVGSPAYAAPEMACGSSIDVRTDVYLLGATLHEILTGRPRHAGQTLSQVLAAATASVPYTYPPSVPAELADLCNWATHRDPAARPPTALAFRQCLADHLRHRSSKALSGVATERLDDLKSELAHTQASAPDRARIYQLLAECRFGFEQALREWRQNEAASTGLTECTTTMVEFEITRRDARAARALLGGLARVPDELSSALSALEMSLLEEEAHRDGLLRLEQDLDLSVSAKHRLAFLGWAAIVIVAISAFAFALTARSGGELTHRTLIVFAAISFCALATFVAAVRRRLLVNAANRRAILSLLAMSGMLFVHRVLAATGGAPVSAILADDLLLLGVGSAVGAATFDRRASWLAGLFTVAAALAALDPAHINALFTVPCVLAVTIICWFWAPLARGEGRPKPGSLPRS